MYPSPATHQRPPATTVAGLAAAALVSAVIPAAAGLAFLISLAARRPLIAVAARRWPWLTGRRAAQPSRRTVTGLTAAWGIGLLAAAAVQGAGAITGGLSLTDPAGFAVRALIALAVEAILAAITITWLHHNPRPNPQAPERKPMTHGGTSGSPSGKNPQDRSARHGSSGAAARVGPGAATRAVMRWSENGAGAGGRCIQTAERASDER